MCDDNLEIVKEALRHTELRLIDLTQIAANADQRAVGFSTACIAIAAILIGLAEKTPAPTINLFGGIGVVIGASVASFTARPRKFHGPGHDWSSWKGHIDDNDKLFDVLVSQATENDQRIEDNMKKLDSAANSFHFAVFIAFSSAILSAVTQLIIHLGSE